MVFANVLVLIVMVIGLFPQSSFARDLKKVERFYEQGRYDKALDELGEVLIDNDDPQAIAWTAKISSKILWKITFYISGWLYLTDDRPTKIWNPQRYIFSQKPNWALNVIESKKEDWTGFEPGTYLEVTAIAAVVETQRVLDAVKNGQSLSKIDAIRLRELEQKINELAKSLIKNQEVVEDTTYTGKTVYPIFSAAKARLHWLIIQVFLAEQESHQAIENLISEDETNTSDEVKNAKKRIKEAEDEFVMQRYGQILSDLEDADVMDDGCQFPDLLSLAGEASIRWGDHVSDGEYWTEQGLKLLLRAQSLKPSPATEALIIEANKTLIASK